MTVQVRETLFFAAVLVFIFFKACIILFAGICKLFFSGTSMLLISSSVTLSFCLTRGRQVSWKGLGGSALKNRDRFCFLDMLHTGD